MLPKATVSRAVAAVMLLMGMASTVLLPLCSQGNHRTAVNNQRDEVKGMEQQSDKFARNARQRQPASSLPGSNPPELKANSAIAQQLLQMWTEYKSGSSPRFCSESCCWQWQEAQVPYQGNALKVPTAEDLISSTNFRRMADMNMINPLDPWESQQRGIDSPAGVLDNVTLPCLQDYTVILTQGHWFHHFAEAYLPQITTKFILITMDGDGTLPGDEFKHILLDARVVHWFASNCGPYQHPKLSCLPLGAAIWNMSLDHQPNFEIVADMLQQGYGLSQGIAAAADPQNKSATNNLLVNFNIDNHVSRPALLNMSCSGPEAPWRSFSTCLAMDYVRSMYHYYQTVAAHRFVLAPRGGGPTDSYRIWETLMMGSYPVVSGFEYGDSGLLDGLPVLVLKNLSSDITPELLDTMYQVYSSQSWSYQKLYMGYWYNLVYQHRAGLNKRYRIVYTKRPR